MMTPNDVAQHRFTTARFGGYNTNDVDEFLDDLTTDYTALYKENAVLKGKMKVLVEKIAEYRSTEDDMRMALLSARKTADGIIAEAEEKRKEMLQNAEAEVAEHRDALHKEIEDCEAQLAAARQSTLDFAAAMRGLVAQQQGYLDQQSEFLNRLDEIKAKEETAPVEETPAAQPEPETSTGDDELERKMAQAAAEAEASPESAYQSFDEGALNAALSGPRPDSPTRVRVDEPTRVVDINAADPDQDYKV